MNKLKNDPINENVFLYTISANLLRATVTAEKTYMKSKDFATLLKGLYPQIITVLKQRDIWIEDENLQYPFIISFEPLNISYIEQEIEFWLKDIYIKTSDIKIHELQTTLTFTFEPNENGTADIQATLANTPLYENGFTIFHQYLATKLGDFSLTFKSNKNEKTYNFSKVVGSDEIEFISEEYLDDNESASFKISLTLATKAHHSSIYAIPHLKIAQWSNNLFKKKRSNRRIDGTSVYVTFDKDFNNQAFSPKMCISVKGTDWPPFFKRFITMQGLGNELPDFKDFKQNTVPFRNKNLLQFHSTYSNMNTYEHFVKRGAGYNERYIASTAIEEMLNQLNFIEDDIIEVKKEKVLNTKFSLSSKIPLHFEIYYETQAYLNEFTDGLKQMLKLDTIEDKFVSEKPELKGLPITLDRQRITELSNLNSFDVKEGKISEFENRLSRSLSVTNDFKMAFVEIKSPEYYKELSLEDPKQTIRKVMMENNRVTQFILSGHELEKNKYHKIDAKMQNCITELLRQTGLVCINTNFFNTNPLHMGVYFIQRKLMIMSRVEDFEVLFSAPQLQIDWCTYPEMQKQLIALRKDSIRPWVFSDVFNVMQNVCSENFNRPVVLYANAENVRYHINWFQNKNITNISPFHDKNGNSFTNLSIVNVLKNQDVPGWVTVSDSEVKANDETTGYFQYGKNHFVSLCQKSDVMQSSNMKFKSKIDNPFTLITQKRLIDIFVPITGEYYNSQQLAHMTHLLRKGQIQYYRMLGDSDRFRTYEESHLPLPISIIEGLEDYIYIN